jgi:myo-inositol 2-dehydrogenase/D-chiro-inositol 1-dehydrogenase
MITGTVVTLTLSRSACYGYDQRCEIFGSEGLASVGNEFANSSIISDSNGAHRPKLKHSFPERFHQAFSSEIDAFADTILFDVPWSITEKDCIAVQRIADAAKKSCGLNQVVEL